MFLLQTCASPVLAGYKVSSRSVKEKKNGEKSKSRSFLPEVWSEEKKTCDYRKEGNRKEICSEIPLQKRNTTKRGNKGKTKKPKTGDFDAGNGTF